MCPSASPGMTLSQGIRIAAIIGSVRPGSNTSKALAIAVDEIAQHDGVTVDVIDPAELDLPLPGSTQPSSDPAAIERLNETVTAATGVLLSTPEYHGSYSSTIKLVIDNLGFPSTMSGKPVALLGVAAGQIGAIKALEHLRSICSHVGAMVLPGPVSIAGVNKVFDDDGRCLDEKIEQRIRKGAGCLIEYIHSHICPRVALEEMIRSGGD